MTPSSGDEEQSRADRISALFSAACEMKHADRAEFLKNECGEDSELHAEVLSLLQFDQAGSGTFAQPAMGAEFNIESLTNQAGDHPIPPDRIGNYKAISVIGDGGMGVVYRAEQQNPSREVALKVIRPELAGKYVLQRFQLEATLLGQLHHPGIAQIFEAGAAQTEEGLQPFFAMELVEGEPLQKYIRKNGLSLHEKLKLLAVICDAVQYSHQKGVIHRDLKPGNILIDQDGNPKILDFGVARSMDADLQLTTLSQSTNQIIGTLPYMSPEQVEGNSEEIDTRSDIYALGVLAYESLAERHPYDLKNRSLPETARVICEVEPKPLGRVNRAYKGDLESIVGKAIDKDKDRRYQSVSDLAADLRRYLNHQPVHARPTSAFYQLRKFSRRNRGLATLLAILIFVVLPTLSGLAIWIAAHQEDVQAQALVERLEATDLLIQQGFSTLDGELGGEEAVPFFQAALDNLESGKRFQQRADALAGLAFALTESEGLDAGLKVLESHPQDFADFPDLERSYAVIYQIAGEVEKEQELIESLPEASSSIGWFLDGRRFLEIGRDAEGETAQEWYAISRDNFHRAILVSSKAKALEYIGLAEAMSNLLEPGPLLMPVTKALSMHWPDNPYALFYIAEALGGSNEAIASRSPSQLQAAEVWFQKALELEPENLMFLYNFANFLDDQHRWSDAEKYYQTAVDLAPTFAWGQHNLGNVLFYQGKMEQAETAYRTALLHYDDALAHYNLADLLYECGRLEEAEFEYLEALRLDPSKLEHHLDFARLLTKTGRAQEAEASFQESLRLAPNNAIVHFNYGWMLDLVGRLEEAEKYYREAIRLDPNDSSPHTNLGWLLQRSGRAKEAEAEYREAIRANPQSPSAHNNLAELLYFEGRWEEAEPEFQEAIRLDSEYATAHLNYAQFLTASERFEEAEREFQAAIQFEPDNAECHSEYGSMLHDLGNTEAAEMELREAIRLDPEHAFAHILLGTILFASARYEEAHSVLLIAHELGSNLDYWPADESAERVAMAKEALELAKEIGAAVDDPTSITDWQTAFALARMAWSLDELEAVVALEERGLELAEGVGDELVAGIGIWNGAEWFELNSEAWDLVDPVGVNPQADVELGLRLAEAAVSLAPEETSVRDTLAWALFANGQYEEAIAASQKALDISPDDQKEEYQGYLKAMKDAVAGAASSRDK